MQLDVSRSRIAQPDGVVRPDGDVCATSAQASPVESGASGATVIASSLAHAGATASAASQRSFISARVGTPGTSRRVRDGYIAAGSRPNLPTSGITNGV